MRNASDWCRGARDHGKEKEEQMLRARSLCANLHREQEVWERGRGSTVFKMQCFAFFDLS